MPRPALPIFIVLFASLSASASAQTASYGNPGRIAPPQMVVTAPPPPPMRSDLGGGFIQFLFGGRNARAARPRADYYGAPAPRPFYANVPAAPPPMGERSPSAHPPIDPRFRRHVVAYDGKEKPGTIIVDTPDHFLYLVQADGKALRYGIGVARKGFAWSGVHHITAKKEWPDWVPPKEMLARQPYLPHVMTGGPDNPLGARALYIGKTLYRIHGSNEPWTIGHNVSSGCIRLRNVDIIDLFSRVNVGTKVVVLGPHGSARDYIPPPTINPHMVERPG